MRMVPAERLPIIDGDTARLPLTKGQVAIIDAADVDAVSGTCWYALWSPKLGTYYAARNASKPLVVGTPSIVYLHRLLIDAPAGRYVDHANHDTLDNRRCNLRVATSRENQRNRDITASNTTGYHGVYRFPGGRRKPWAVHASIDSRTKHIGYFATAFEAALGRDAWIRENCPSEFWTFNVPLLPGERGITQPEGATA